MKKCLVIFPHQLHRDHHGFSKKPDQIVLIEDSLFFLDHQYAVNFHKQKLILHRSSMQQYKNFLEDNSFKVTYKDYQLNGLASTFQELASENVELLIADTVDFALNRRIKSFTEKLGLSINWLPSQLFINSNQDNHEYKDGKKRWFMANFYQFQRQRLNILMEDSQPMGGKWSFDEENRKKIPKKNIPLIPKIEHPQENEYVKEAREYIKHKFPDAIGSDEQFFYPSNFAEADDWLERFFEQRFDLFGPYEDALVPNTHWLYHSVLTPMLNTGLLSPNIVVDKAISYAEKHDIPLASLEGFVRQIIGWREFMRATYVDLGAKMRTTNHWQHTRTIPKSFYEGSTGIKPIDDVIKRTLDTGYCHHIERLMVLGGFMFLCEFKPDDIYRWFMELFIDSYDWVMVTNVYAMSQNADGGLITTKPYFSGSNYLKKMGYTTGKYDELWTSVWDGLYWRWINLHSHELSKNPRWSMMCAMARKMDKEKLQIHINTADDFLSNLSDS